MEFRRKGLEGAYRLGVPISGHGDDMLFSPDINAGCMRVDQGESLELNPFAGFTLLFAYRLIRLINGAGPARQRNRFTRLSNGVGPP